MEHKKLRSGDDCPLCAEGWLYVYCSKRQGEYRVRYLRCKHCGKCPPNNIEVVPIGRKKRRGTEPRPAVIRLATQ